jgi:oligopeptide transport system permease protein
VIVYALRRLLGIPLVLLATFAPLLLLVRVAPNGPFDPRRALPPVVESALAAECDGDEPALLQVAAATSSWIRLSVDGCTGRSLQDGRPVLELVGGALPASVSLAALALLLAVAGGATAGVILARTSSGVSQRAGRGAVAVVEAIPGFVLAPLMVLVFGLGLGVVAPARLMSQAAWVVPAGALALAFSATVCRVVRDALLAPDALVRRRADLARGLSAGAADARAVRLALLPVVAGLAPMASAMVMGGIAVERVFDLPGLGPLILEAADARDYNLLLGGVLAYALVLLVANLGADLLYGLLDPRVRRRR